MSKAAEIPIWWVTECCAEKALSFHLQRQIPSLKSPSLRERWVWGWGVSVDQGRCLEPRQQYLPSKQVRKSCSNKSLRAAELVSSNHSIVGRLVSLLEVAPLRCEARPSGVAHLHCCQSSPHAQAIFVLVLRCPSFVGIGLGERTATTTTSF